MWIYSNWKWRSICEHTVLFYNILKILGFFPSPPSTRIKLLKKDFIAKFYTSGVSFGVQGASSLIASFGMFCLTSITLFIATHGSSEFIFTLTHTDGTCSWLLIIKTIFPYKSLRVLYICTLFSNVGLSRNQGSKSNQCCSNYFLMKQMLFILYWI